jgi:hypothetical protein
MRIYQCPCYTLLNTSHMHKHLNQYKFHFIIFGIFLIQFLFISPIGEFALNDDWVHTLTMKEWVDTGVFRMLPFAGPTFYVPILYGALLTKLFGFSFTLLRLSTLALMLGTNLAFFTLLKRVGAHPVVALLGTLLLWLNPITYNLSFTFMTDIPALFLLIFAILCYLKGFESRHVRWFFFGSIISVLGFYTRQTNILLLGTAGLMSLLYLPNIKFRGIVWSFGIPLVVGGSIYIWLGAHGLLPQSTDTHVIIGLGRAIGHMKWWTWYILFYIGLFLLPFAIGYFFKIVLNHFRLQKKKSPVIASPAKTERRNPENVYSSDGIATSPLRAPRNDSFLKKKISLRWYHFPFQEHLQLSAFAGLKKSGIDSGVMMLVIMTIITILFAFMIDHIFNLRFPYVGNMITEFGVGPMQGVLNGTLAPLFSSKLLLMLTLLGAGSTGWLLHQFLAHRKIPRQHWFILLFGLFYTAVLLFFESFDRYIVPLIVVSMIWILPKIECSKMFVTTAGILIACTGIYSISQTQYYLAWNEARWILANKAHTFVDEPFNIDGGYEWNGWHAYWLAIDSDVRDGPSTAPWWIRGLFVNNTEDYIVSFSPIAPYHVIETTNVRGWNRNTMLYLLKKPGPQTIESF